MIEINNLVAMFFIQYIAKNRQTTRKHKIEVLVHSLPVKIYNIINKQ